MNVRVSTLENGLRIVSHRMDTVETVSLGAWVNTGTRYESADINGVSHLLEHMAFKGTERRTARAIAEEIEAVGGHLNAYTSREQTAYHATVLKADAGLAIDVIADILQHSTFDEQELARERAVVLQEIGLSLDTPDDIIFDHFQTTAFPDQPLGWPVLGTADLVSGMERTVLMNYMARHYTAPRMVFSAAGNLNHDEIVSQAAAAFDGLQQKREDAREPARYGGGNFREARDLEQVHFLLGFEGIAYQDPDYYALAILSTILGGGMSSRLFQEIRENRGLVYSIYAFPNSYTDGGLFGIYAGTGETETGELIPVLCEEIMKTGNNIGEDELKRAQAQLKAGILMSLESTASRAEQLGRQMLVFDRPIPIEEVIQYIDSVDVDAVQHIARRITASPPTVAAMGPIAKVEAYDSIASRLG